MSRSISTGDNLETHDEAHLFHISVIIDMGGMLQNIHYDVCMLEFIHGESWFIYLYLYKIGALFDLRHRTPPRPLALEG